MIASVVIQGGPASFSALAAESHFEANTAIVHCPSFQTALEAFDKKQCRHLLLPWWNRCIGPIHEVHALIRRAGLEHHSQIAYPVDLCLIGYAPDGLTGRVHSHPAALAQCRAFFRSNPALLPQAAPDTADSLRLIRCGSSELAIASKHAATLHGLPVVSHGIQDRPDNYTVFRVYKRECDVQCRSQ